jgi:hypothetical protein
MQAVNRLIEQQIAERGLAGMVYFISVDSDQP